MRRCVLLMSNSPLGGYIRSLGRQCGRQGNMSHVCVTGLTIFGFQDWKGSDGEQGSSSSQSDVRGRGVIYYMSSNRFVFQGGAVSKVWFREQGSSSSQTDVRG